MTSGSKPKGMGINCSWDGGTLLLAPGLLTAEMGGAVETVGVEVAVVAGEEGCPGAVGTMLSEMAGEDAAAGLEGGTAGPSGTDVGEGEAVDAVGSEGGVTGLDDTAGEAVKAVGLAAVDPAGVDVMPGVGGSVVAGTAVIDGKGSNSGDGVGVCTEVDAGVGAGVTDEMVGCVKDGENRGVEGNAYGEATCRLELQLNNKNGAAAYIHSLFTLLQMCTL